MAVRRLANKLVADVDGTELHCTQHAFERIVQYEVDINDIMAVYKNPSAVQPDAHDPMKRNYEGVTTRGRRLKICVGFRDETPRLVTAYYRDLEG